MAKRFNTTATVIREMNDLPAGPLTVGEDVRVPSTVTDLPPKVMLAAAQVDGHGRVSRRAHVQVVRHGDSLWTIARRHGMDVNTLALMNGMHPDDQLRAGQHIKLSSGSAASVHKVRRMMYTVREGDTVAQIARLFQCSVPQLLALERPDLEVPHPYRAEAAHPPRLAPRLTSRSAPAGTPLRHNPRRRLQTWVFSPASAP